MRIQDLSRSPNRGMNRFMKGMATEASLAQLIPQPWMMQGVCVYVCVGGVHAVEGYLYPICALVVLISILSVRWLC
jgi:hypothetical protein